MSQRRYRELRKTEEKYTDTIAELMDCRGDVLSLESTSKGNSLNLYGKAFYVLLGASLYALASK